jgi:hypothetical protein
MTIAIGHCCWNPGFSMSTVGEPLYGHQEGAVVGYNPTKPGRPSHTYQSYLLANLRLAEGPSADQALISTRPAGRVEGARSTIGAGTGKYILMLEQGLGGENVWHRSLLVFPTGIVRCFEPFIGFTRASGTTDPGWAILVEIPAFLRLSWHPRMIFEAAKPW